MKKLQGIGESLLLFAIMFLVYEIMYYSYMFIIRLGIRRGWPWIDSSQYNPFNLDEASLFYVKDHPVEYTILSWLVIMLLLVVTLALTKGHVLESMSIKWLSLGNFLVSITVGLGLVFFINGIISFAIEVTGSELTYIPEDLYATYDLTFLIATVGICAPVFEEIFFRGLMMGRLMRGFSWMTGVLLTAVVFSVSHLNISQSIFVFPVGLLCGILVARSGSVFAGIWLHITYNVVNIYLAKMPFFQYNSLQLLILIVFGAGLMYFGLSHIRGITESNL